MDEQLATEYYNAGLNYIKAGELDKALESLNKAISEYPDHVNSHNALGKIYRQKGELDKAKRCWRAALKIDPDNLTAKQSLEAAEEPAQIQLKALLWVAAVVVLVLAALLITNVIQFQRINRLKNDLELAEAKAPEPQELETRVDNETEQKDEQEQPVKPPEETITQPPSETKPPMQTSRSVPPTIAQRQPETKPPIQATRSVPPIVSPPIAKVYDQALTNCRSGWYDQAIEGFQKILEHSSAHDLKDNAQYWLAECYYAQKEYS